MFKLSGVVIAIGALIIGWWWWRKNAVQSPLDDHYTSLTWRQQIGNLTQAAAVGASIPIAMLGEGWATSLRANRSNPNPIYNSPGPTRFNFNFAQPTFWT